MKRVKIAVSDELLLQLVTTGWKSSKGFITECISGLPEGAEIVGVYRGYPDKTVFEVQHLDFADIPDGQEPPFFTPTFSREVSE